VGIDSGVGSEADSVNCCDPCPRTATNKHPRAPFGFEGSTGKFGHPITPSSTRASTRSARQTAYCSPRKNPFVPSIGSRVHIRPLRPPPKFPRSMASNSSSSVFTCPGPIPHSLISPKPSSPPNAWLASSTIRDRNKEADGVRRSEEDSSPTIGS